MKIVLKLFLMFAVIVGSAFPGLLSSAEAANIIVMPLIENSGYAGVEEVFYDNTIAVIKDQTKYNMIENDAVTAAIDKYSKKGILPDENALRNIANEADADLVVCVELNKIDMEELIGFSKEDKVNLEIWGNSVSYNRETDKFNHRKLHDHETYDPAMYVRQNYPLRKFARLLQNDMRRIMKVKGFKVERPQIQKF